MAFQQYFNLCRNGNPFPPPSSAETENNSACFDCNICLEFASDPVVTLCGHLYCWPCIYKWFDSKSSSVSCCPICKSEISEKTMIPLYGRGQSFSESDPTKEVIPPRPPASRIKVATVLPGEGAQPTFGSGDPYHHHNTQSLMNSNSNYEGVSLAPSLNLYGTAAMALSHHMFGETINASREFGTTSDSLYLYPDSYQSVTRLRRLELQADKSLNRVSIFLFCCFVLCFLLF